MSSRRKRKAAWGITALVIHFQLRWEKPYGEADRHFLPRHPHHGSAFDQDSRWDCGRRPSADLPRRGPHQARRLGISAPKKHKASPSLSRSLRTSVYEKGRALAKLIRHKRGHLRYSPWLGEGDSRMDKLAALPIDGANVNWPYVCSLVALVFVCTFFGSALSLGRTILCCVLTALLFATAFIYWTYYPHDLPLPTLATP